MKHLLMLFVFVLGSLPPVWAGDSQNYEKLIKEFKREKNFENFSQEDLDELDEILDQELANQDIHLDKNKKRVRFSEIKSWQWLGDRFSMGIGEQGEMLAIYDLSWPQIFSSDQFPRTLLGSVGVGNFNLAYLIDLIKDAVNRDNQEALSSSGKTSKVRKMLDALKGEYGELQDNFPENWWKEVVWKNPMVSLSEEEPVRFTLADMDLARMSKDEEKFNRLEQKNNLRLRELLDLDIRGSFFSYFEFVRRENSKGYDLFFVVPESDLVTQSKVSNPKKVADLRNPNKNFLQSFGLIAVEQGLKQILSFIPVPIVANLLDVAIGRWFNLLEQQEEAHHAYTLEYLDLARMGHNNTPFSTLSDEIKEKIGEYLVGQQATWFKIIFKGKDGHYQKYLDDRQSAQEKSLSWLSDKGWTVSEQMSSGFAKAQKEDKNHLFILSEHFRLGRHPLSALNYQNPGQQVAYRQLIELGDVALDLINIPIPFASTALGLVYSYFLQDPIENAQTEEARLRAFVRTDSTDRSFEADQMIRRRLNPFELSPEGEELLIAKRRASLGI